jgi:AmiR/NasT family two-component response regulator
MAPLSTITGGRAGDSCIGIRTGAVVRDLSKRELSNRKVLVVEDEMMIAMLIEDMLDEFGCELVGPATNVPRALELIGKESLETAVLDLNLDGQDKCADLLLATPGPRRNRFVTA